MLGFELAAFVAGVLQDLPGGEARGQDAQAVAGLGVHGAGDDRSGIGVTTSSIRPLPSGTSTSRVTRALLG